MAQNIQFANSAITNLLVHASPTLDPISSEKNSSMWDRYLHDRSNRCLDLLPCINESIVQLMPFRNLDPYTLDRVHASYDFGSQLSRASMAKSVYSSLLRQAGNTSPLCDLAATKVSWASTCRNQWFLTAKLSRRSTIEAGYALISSRLGPLFTLW